MGFNEIIRVPIFYDDDLEEWISWMEKYFSDQGFLEEEKLQFGSAYIEGDARTWFESHDSRVPFTNWEALKAGLLVRFGNDKDHQYIRDIAEIKQLLRELIRLRSSQTEASVPKLVASEEVLKEEVLKGETLSDGEKLMVPRDIDLPMVPSDKESQMLEGKKEIGDESAEDAYQVFDQMPVEERGKTKKKRTDDENAKTVSQLFEEMSVREKRKTKKKKKRWRKLSKIKSCSRFKWFICKCRNLTREKLLQTHKNTSMKSMLRFTKKKKKKKSVKMEHERKDVKNKLRYANLQWAKKTTTKKLPKWKNGKGLKFKGQQKKDWLLLPLNVGVKPDHQQESTKITPTKRKSKAPKSKRIKWGWKKAEEVVNDILCYFEIRLLQGVTRERIEIYAQPKWKKHKFKQKPTKQKKIKGRLWANQNAFLWNLKAKPEHFSEGSKKKHDYDSVCSRFKLSNICLLTQLRWLLRVTQRKKKRKRPNEYVESQKMKRVSVLDMELKFAHATNKGNGEQFVVIKVIHERLCDSFGMMALDNGSSSTSELDANLENVKVKGCFNLDAGEDKEKKGLAGRGRYVKKQRWRISMLLGKDVMLKQMIFLISSVFPLTEKNKSSEMGKQVKFEMGERQVKETIPKVKKHHNETWNEILFDQAHHEREVEDSVKTSCGVNRFYYDRTRSTSSREITDTSLILIKAMERRICDSLGIKILGFRGGNTALVTTVEKELAWKGFSTQLGRD